MLLAVSWFGQSHTPSLSASGRHDILDMLEKVKFSVVAVVKKPDGSNRVCVDYRKSGDLLARQRNGRLHPYRANKFLPRLCTNRIMQQ